MWPASWCRPWCDPKNRLNVKTTFNFRFNKTEFGVAKPPVIRLCLVAPERLSRWVRLRRRSRRPSIEDSVACRRGFKLGNLTKISDIGDLVATWKSWVWLYVMRRNLRYGKGFDTTKPGFWGQKGLYFRRDIELPLEYCVSRSPTWG